jgi:hypothetical protein
VGGSRIADELTAPPPPRSTPQVKGIVARTTHSIPRSFLNRHAHTDAVVSLKLHFQKPTAQRAPAQGAAAAAVARRGVAGGDDHAGTQQTPLQQLSPRPEARRRHALVGEAASPAASASASAEVHLGPPPPPPCVAAVKQEPPSPAVGPSNKGSRPGDEPTEPGQAEVNTARGVPAKVSLLRCVWRYRYQYSGA